jgi:Transglutaminase-like superfamily
MSIPVEPQLLNWRDKFLAIRIGLLIPVIEIWMRTSSFQRCQRGLLRLARALPPYTRKVTSPAEAEKLARLVALGNQRYSLYPADCLTVSLALQYVITRLGGQAELCLGVRTITGQFEAHAWVEVEGVPLNQLESVNDVYSRMDWTKRAAEKARG